MSRDWDVPNLIVRFRTRSLSPAILGGPSRSQPAGTSNPVGGSRPKKVPQKKEPAILVYS